jgi:hypothetical protein
LSSSRFTGSFHSRYFICSIVDKTYIHAYITLNRSSLTFTFALHLYIFETHLCSTPCYHHDHLPLSSSYTFLSRSGAGYPRASRGRYVDHLTLLVQDRSRLFSRILDLPRRVFMNYHMQGQTISVFIGPILIRCVGYSRLTNCFFQPKQVLQDVLECFLHWMEPSFAFLT